MAQIIDTLAGPLLTSPMNAHSFLRGDLVVIGNDEAGYAVLTVFNVQQIPDAPAKRWIQFEDAAPAVNRAGCGAATGDLFGMEFEANEPLNRVVGGRSTAGGSHS
jgi:hypothetical protein